MTGKELLDYLKTLTDEELEYTVTKHDWDISPGCRCGQCYDWAWNAVDEVHKSDTDKEIKIT